MDIHYQAFFFDLDGTLQDSENLWTESMVISLKRRNIDVTFEEIVDFGYGRAWDDIFDVIEERWPGTYPNWEAMLEDFRPYYEEVFRTRDISFPDAIRMLSAVKDAGYYVAIVTGSHRQRALSLVERKRLNVDLIVGVEDYRDGKPSPEPYLTAARLGGFAPEDCLVIEDSGVGIASAQAAGMAVIAVDRMKRPQEVAQAQVVLDSLDDFALPMAPAMLRALSAKRPTDRP